MRRPAAEPNARAIAVWLFVLCAMVLAMIVLGGVTRLTESGLSIVDWRPLLGWVPPMSEAEWQALFERYKAFPEYQKKNFGMTLAGFKDIFWLEYLHRLWGRVIGLAFAVPFAVFWWRRAIPAGLGGRLLAIFALGAAQGVLGWLMVQSGLVDRPAVSQYRLAAHLGLAFLILGLMFWTALGLLAPREGASSWPRRRAAAQGALVMVSLTVIMGAFVAGLDAGLVCNDFPTTCGAWVPDDAFRGGVIAAFEDTLTAQFVHRCLGVLTVLAVIGAWLATRFGGLPAPVRAAPAVLFMAVTIQAMLGIGTLIAFVPVWLAALHQAGAALTFLAAIWAVHALSRKEEDAA